MAADPIQFKPKNKINPLIIMVVVAVLLGLVAAGGIWQYLNQAQEQVKKLSATRPVVIASKEIPAGTKLTEEFLTIKQFPTQTTPKDYPSSIETLKGRLVKSTLNIDEVITETRLVGKENAGLPLIIPPGQRAITIRVNEVVGVGGFINPGDHVDVVSILKDNQNHTFSKTILQNVLVLAVGDKILDLNAISDFKPKIVSQVTLALNVEDSEKVSLAGQVGQLQLSLRPFGENNLLTTTGVKLEDVYGELAYTPSEINNKILSEMPLENENTDANKNSIEIISGSQKSYFYY